MRKRDGDVEIFAEHAGNADLLREAGQDPDHENDAADLGGLDRLRERVLADLDNVVDAAAAPIFLS
jgi:hypothetical protein